MNDLEIYKRSSLKLVLHERKTRLTLISCLMGKKTAAETGSALIPMLKRLYPVIRGSITFGNNGDFARHVLLRDMLSAITYFCDASSFWQKGGIENTNGRIKRWFPRSIDFDQVRDEDIQEIIMTLNATPRKCVGLRIMIETKLDKQRIEQIKFA